MCTICFKEHKRRRDDRVDRRFDRAMRRYYRQVNRRERRLQRIRKAAKAAGQPCPDLNVGRGIPQPTLVEVTAGTLLDSETLTADWSTKTIRNCGMRVMTGQ